MVVGPVHLLLFELVVHVGLDQMVGGVMTRIVVGGEVPGSSSYIVHPSHMIGLVRLNQVGQRAEVSSRTDVGQNIELGHGKRQGVGPLALLCSVYFEQGHFFLLALVTHG